MGRLEDIERRLLNWARWRSGLMSGGLGYVSASMQSRVDGEGWDAQSVIPTDDIEASATDDAVNALDPDLCHTVHVYYLSNCGRGEQAQRLRCSESALKERIGRAHQKLSNWFAEKALQARQQRERVEALQQLARPPQPPPGPFARRVIKAKR